MLIINITVFTAVADTIQNGFIKISGNKITNVGTMECCPFDETPIDMLGYTAYPGFIDAHCHIGMWSDGYGVEDDDGNEDTDPVTPQLRAIDAVNAMDNCFMEAYKAGVTCVVTGPGSSNPIAGQMLAMKTYGNCVDDMAVRQPQAMKFALGENPKNTYHLKDEQPATRMATAALIREQLIKAERYKHDMDIFETNPDDNDRPEFDFKSECLMNVLDGKMQSHIHAHRMDDIFTAMRISDEFGLDTVLIHCTEGFMCAEKIAERKIPAVVGPLLCSRSKPELAHERIDNIVTLFNAGVKTAICTDHPEVPEKYLLLSAAAAVKAGMPHDDAIRAVTSVPADILGLSDRIGSISAGMEADIAIFKGDPLSFYEDPEMVIINGNIVFDRKSADSME